MNKKELLQVLKYWKLESVYEMKYKALSRMLEAKNLRINYKIYNNCWDPKNNLHWLDYILWEFEKYGAQFNFVKLSYKWNFTNTKFCEYYIFIDWKYYFICYDMSKKDQVKESKLVLEYLINNYKKYEL